jgi:superfamily II DNA/RNA helicase
LNSADTHGLKAPGFFNPCTLHVISWFQKLWISNAACTAYVVALLAPTRELAKQVHTDFAHIGEAFKLNAICVYGGAPYGDQERSLRAGTDIVIGTPVGLYKLNLV